MMYKIVEKFAQYWVVFVAFGLQLFLLGSLLTFSPTDHSWFYHASDLQPYKNMFGMFGSYSASWLIYCFGRSALPAVFLMIYVVFLYYALFVGRRLQFYNEWDRAAGAVGGFFVTTVFYQVFAWPSYDFSYSGGIVGKYLTHHFLWCFDLVTQKIIVISLLCTSFILITRCAFLPLFFYAIRGVRYCCDREKIPARLAMGLYASCFFVVQYLVRLSKKSVDLWTGAALNKMNSSIVEFEREEPIDADIEQVVQDLFWDDYAERSAYGQNHMQQESQVHDFAHTWTTSRHEPEYVEDQPRLQDVTEQASVFDVMQAKQSSKVAPSLHAQEFEAPQNLIEDDSVVQEQMVTEQIIAEFEKPKIKEYALPSLKTAKIETKTLQEKQEVLALQAKTLEEKLAQFDIEGNVVGMHSGPVVTLFEYQPDIKVKVSRILALEDDLAMALKALSIRIIAPIPGRSVVGFEVSNQHRQDVLMARIIQGQEFKNYPGALPMIFGQDTLGNDVIADLAKMPHLLIAGSTGSGKSVALNAMLISLLCSLKPDELKLIIIDPKRLEFAAYDGIGHLIFPIVTDTKKAIPVLKWVVQTMEQRYAIMAKYGVRNLGDYKVAAQRNKEMEAMPYIVVIIDELADLMMTAGKAVEDSIARIAQMARAAGIHMIIATQRPSVDVITGMIKVNFPNRVAFKVTSKIDSRTILDAAGAEKLLGRGDMLFLDATKSHLVRAHGAYISDQEIHDIVLQIKRQSVAQYLDIFEQFEQNQSQDFLDGDDELYQEIVQFIQELDEISISMLQRRFRIGYNRSARMISILESKGLIMTTDGGKTRRVVK